MLKFRWPHSRNLRTHDRPPLVPVRSASWRFIGKSFQEGRQHWRSKAGLTDKEGRRANCNESGKTPLTEGSGSYHLVRAHLGTEQSKQSGKYATTSPRQHSRNSVAAVSAGVPCDVGNSEEPIRHHQAMRKGRRTCLWEGCTRDRRDFIGHE
jgi:hypothetical protein